MLRLGPRSRGALAAAGLTAFALAYATTPLLAGDNGTPLAAETPLVRTVTPVSVSAAAVSPRRDPFAGIPEPQGTAAPSAAAAAPAPTLPPLPSLPTIPGAIGILPPNAGAALGPPPRDDVRVTALVTGAHASAIVEERGKIRVVTLGDDLAGERVTAIDAAGVHVTDGTTYHIAPASQPLPMTVQPLAPPPSFPLPPAAALGPALGRPHLSPQSLPSGGPP